MVFFKFLQRTRLPSMWTSKINPPCKVGDSLENIDTPALLIDMDKLEKNLRHLPTTLPSDNSVRIRPHGKAHKCPNLGLLQEKIGGCRGICAQTLTEAEAFVEGGLRDVFLSNQVIGRKKLDRLADLAKVNGISLSLCVDDPENVQDISRAVSEKGDGIQIGIVVEVNVGQERCGVEPGQPAVDLARCVMKYPNLNFLGIQCYQGLNQHVRTIEDRSEAVGKVINMTKLTLKSFEDAGVECKVVTGGGTGTYLYEAASGVFTEVQPGSYALMDVDYNKNMSSSSEYLSSVYHQSLFVLSSVQSVSKGKRAVLDCGMKGVSLDSGPPQVFNLPNVEYICGGDEHGILRPCGDLKVGDLVWLIPGHCDPTVNLYDWIVGIRNDRVEELWPITGRGPGV